MYQPTAQLVLEYNKICIKDLQKLLKKEFRSSDFFSGLSIRFALFTIRPLVARFELQRGPDASKEGFLVGFPIESSLFNKLKKETFWRPYFYASPGPRSFAAARGTVVESDRK